MISMSLNPSSIGQREITRLKWVTTLVPTLSVFIYETIRHDLLEHWLPVRWGNFLVGLLVFGLAYAFSTLIFGIVTRLQSQLLRRGQEMAALAAAVEERERLSRELHDGLAQLVAYLLVRLDTVVALVTADRRSEALAELERLRTVADDLYVDVREAIAGLRSRVAERGLVSALSDYAAQFEERYGLAVDLNLAAMPADLPSAVGLDLFRIVQEALTNTRKHANASRAWVTVDRPTPDLVCLVIGDDGTGFNPTIPPPRGTIGLATMRERAAAFGGQLMIDSQPGGGTRVTVTIPFVGAPLEKINASMAAAAR
jgi:signal transduction histidine kinase